MHCHAITFLIPLLLLAPSTQDPDRPDRQDPAVPAFAKMIETLIPALYETVSFAPGGEPDWQRLRSMCLPGASFVQPVRRGDRAKAISTDDFVALFKDDIVRQRMKERGFHERVARVVKTGFGNLTHCYVVFEIRIDPKAEKARFTGVDSIQLVRDGGRWWIASITTDFVRPGRPLPEFLRKQQAKSKVVR